MEFSGDEKRIQALFSELSLEDQTRAPSFEKLCTRTEAPAPLVRRFVMVATAILAAVCLIAALSLYRSSQFEHAANIPPQTIPTTTSDVRVIQPEQLANAKELRTVRPPRILRPRQNPNVVIRQAELISKWQSPTSTLLNSPTASVLSSLPQLTSSARDLEQFLPKNNDVTKESKQ